MARLSVGIKHITACVNGRAGTYSVADCGFVACHKLACPGRVTHLCLRYEDVPLLRGTLSEKCGIIGIGFRKSSE